MIGFQFEKPLKICLASVNSKMTNFLNNICFIAGEIIFFFPSRDVVVYLACRFWAKRAQKFRSLF